MTMVELRMCGWLEPITETRKGGSYSLTTGSQKPPYETIYYRVEVLDGVCEAVTLAAVSSPVRSSPGVRYR